MIVSVINTVITKYLFYSTSAEVTDPRSGKLPILEVPDPSLYS